MLSILRNLRIPLFYSASVHLSFLTNFTDLQFFEDIVVFISYSSIFYQPSRGNLLCIQSAGRETDHCIGKNTMTSFVRGINHDVASESAIGTRKSNIVSKMKSFCAIGVGKNYNKSSTCTSIMDSGIFLDKQY